MSEVKPYSEVIKERGVPGQHRAIQRKSPATTKRWNTPIQNRRPQPSAQRSTTPPRRSSNNHTWSHPTPSSGKPNWRSSTTTKQRNWGPFSIPDGTLPYAYQPTTEMFIPETGFLSKKFKIPTFWEVVKELGWLIFEAALAAAGHAVFQFFAGHRRFHPGPGKM